MKGFDMTPYEARAAMSIAIKAQKEPGVRTFYSQREYALLKVLLRILHEEGYFDTVEMFERESDGVIKL